MQDILGKAIALAVESHAGQINKKGDPYILHPLRMMFKANTIEEKIIAVLHDVIEKTEKDFQFLHNAGFSDKIILAVDALSRRPQESYDTYIDRVAENQLAKNIKILDLKDNIYSLNIDKSEHKKSAQLLKYQTALDRLI